MTLDEYEAIRLMDLENLQQEQAAAQMGVARTTVQLIYNNARRKLADCLVNGKRLVIEGGDVALCERHTQCPDADIAAAAAARNIKNKCRKRKNRCFGNGFFVILRDRAHSGTARFSLRRFRRKLP